MTALILACVIIQSPVDHSELAQVEHALRRKFQAAVLALQKDPPQTIQMLDEALADPRIEQFAPHSANVSVYRDQMIYWRAQARLCQGNAQTVVEEMTALLDRKRNDLAIGVARAVGSLATLDPQFAVPIALRLPHPERLNRRDWHQALAIRSSAWKELDQPDRVQADMDAIAVINQELDAEAEAIGYEDEDYEDDEWWPPGQAESYAKNVVAIFSSAYLLIVLFVGMIPVFFLMGLRQRRDGHGTWARLVAVAVLLAILQTLPVAVAFLVVWAWPDFYQSPTLVAGTVVVFGVNFFRHRAFLQPVTWTTSNQAPALLKDEAVLARIEEIAERMGVRVPVARVVHSASAQQSNEAMIAGFVAPTLILHDGILHRLSEEERDAIIAHELAHLSNRTFESWLLAGVAVSGAVVFAAAFFQPLVVIALGSALLTGVSLILTRWLELDSDRQAARAIGHRRTASALHKIHADQPFRQSPLLEFLIGATSTHPSRDERLAAIYQDAPADARPDIEWNPALLSRRRWAAWTMTALWLLILSGSLVWAQAWPDSRLPALPMFLVPVVPFVFLWLGLRPTLRRRGQLQKKRTSWLAWMRGVPPILLLGYIVLHWFGFLDGIIDPTVNLGIILLGLVLSAVVSGLYRRSDRATALNQRLAVAIQSDDYRAAVELCEDNLEIVESSTELRHNYALVLAVLGERDDAIARLESLRKDDPGFKLTWLTLCSLYEDAGDFQSALALAEQLSRDLPSDSIGLQVESWMLMKLDRLDEAEARARAVLLLEPEAGQAYLTLASVALKRGDVDTARHELAQAERFVPGTVGVAIVAAELALTTNDPNAEATVIRAVKAARTTPLAFAEREVNSLVERVKVGE